MTDSHLNENVLVHHDQRPHIDVASNFVIRKARLVAERNAAHLVLELACKTKQGPGSVSRPHWSRDHLVSWGWEQEPRPRHSVRMMSTNLGRFFFLRQGNKDAFLSCTRSTKEVNGLCHWEIT